MQENIQMHWTKAISEEAIKLFGDKQVVAGGWSPSGIFHIGNAKESIVCNGIHKMLKSLGKDTQYIFIIDDSDPLDRIPVNFKKYSKELKKYLGHPINKIPDPTNQFNSYADYYFNQFAQTAEEWGYDIEFIRASKLYEDGKYDEYLLLYLENEEKVQKLIEGISGSRLDSFISITCQNCGNAKTTRILDISNLESIRYVCKSEKMYRGCDFSGELNYKEGGWKLRWRLDWPARQSFLGVTIETAGKDHAVEGGSIDTARAIHRELFHKEPPYMTGYGLITYKGKKMSGSKGNGVPTLELKKFLDPFAYLFLNYRNNQKTDVEFNPAAPMFPELIDEFMTARRLINGFSSSLTEKEEQKLKTAALLALPDEKVGLVPANVRFNELVLLYQVSLRDADRTIESLKQTGKIEDGVDLNELRALMKRIDYWLDNFAPKAVLFQILDEIPEGAKSYWDDLIKEVWLTTLEKISPDLTKNEVMDILREVAAQNNVPIKKIFQAFYQLLTGKNVGPNAAQLTLTYGIDKLKQRINSL